MKFSVIVPVYRAERYLDHCLNSIKEQTYTDFECIVVDDGSDDSCPEICDRFASEDRRFSVIHKKNGGANSSRKVGSSAAKGEYIVCVDGDDFVDKTLLENLDRLINEYSPDTVLYGANRYTHCVENSFCSSVETGYYAGAALDEVLNSYLYDPDLKGINDGRILFYVWCKCIKRDLYLKCQSEVDDRISTGEDAVFTLLWKKHLKSAYFTDYCGYYYRSNEGSLERTFKTDCLENLDFATAEMRRICPDFSEKIDIYYFYRVLKLSLMAAQQLEYKEYIRFFKEQFTKDRALPVKRAKLTNHTVPSYIKYLLIKHRMWNVLYLLANTWFSGKFN